MSAGQILAAGISQSDWSFNNRAVNGSKLLRDSLTYFDVTAIAKEQICRGQCVALRYSCRFRRIVISFLSLLRMAFGLTQAVSHLEHRSTVTVKYVSRFIVSCLEVFI